MIADSWTPTVSKPSRETRYCEGQNLSSVGKAISNKTLQCVKREIGLSGRRSIEDRNRFSAREAFCGGSKNCQKAANFSHRPRRGSPHFMWVFCALQVNGARNMRFTVSVSVSFTCRRLHTLTS
jgi:hypothetical protein